MIGRRLAATAFLCGVLSSACAHPSEAKPDGSVSVTEFDRASKQYVGKVVSIAGYLVPTYPDLMLYINESTPPIQEAPIVFIEDRELGKTAAKMNYGEASILEDAGCVNRYAVVTGEVGQTAHGWPGIVRIDNVRVYKGADFSGPGTVCYSKEE